MVSQANDRANLLYIDDAMRGQDTPNKSVENSVNPGGAGGTTAADTQQRKSARKPSTDRKKEGKGADGDRDHSQPMNVILLKKEVDLE